MTTERGIKEAQEHNEVAQVVPTTARARVEIDEFLGDNDMTNLFLLALEAMQIEDPTKSVAKGDEDWWTFYSLSGIHGLPPESWDGIPKNTRGYCTHGALIFPTWHRVYIAMFEQAVANKVQEIADQYANEPEKSIYQNAASRFRLPYWDPLVPRNPVEQSPGTLDEGIWGLPKVLAAKNVFVKRPGASTLDPIPNPLYQFQFPKQNILQQKQRTPVDWDQTDVSDQGKQYTVRCPSDTGDTDVDELNSRIQQNGQNISTKLWKLLSRYNTENDNEARSWEAFSTHWELNTTTLQPKINPSTGRPIFRDTSVSLESWHDDIHGLIGSGNGFEGHMGNPAIAGFDPIFWLHHCNIDRLLAIYQVLYPNKWLPSTGRQSGSSKLAPFRHSADRQWDSNGVRDWKNLGFAIPGNKDLDSQGIQDLETYLSEYYSWATEGTFPPPSVAEKWPKDLSGSVALYGGEAHPTTQPLVQFEALEGSGLVTRTVDAVSPHEPARIEVVDQPRQIAVKDVAASKPELYPPGMVQDGNLPTWNARILIRKFAFNGSFNIYLFIGPITDVQPSDYTTDRSEIGFSAIFASPTGAPCAGCAEQREAGLVYEDAIPITHSLFPYLRSNNSPGGPPQERRTLDSFRPEHVIPFLKDRLEWRITDTASNLLAEDEAALLESGLEVTVSVRDFELPTEERPMGIYRPAVVYKEITEEKVGGYGYTPGSS